MKTIAMFIVVLVIGFLIGFLTLQTVYRNGYYHGQIDFQQGNVEWLLVGPQEVIHVK